MTTINEDQLEQDINAYKKGMILERKMRERMVRVCEENKREKEKSCNGSSCKGNNVSWELSLSWCDPPSPCICFISFLYL